MFGDVSIDFVLDNVMNVRRKRHPITPTQQFSTLPVPEIARTLLNSEIPSLEFPLWLRERLQIPCSERAYQNPTPRVPQPGLSVRPSVRLVRLSVRHVR
jgi:hypothetical protein